MKERIVSAAAVRVGTDNAGGTVNLGVEQHGSSEMLVLRIRWGEAMGLAHSMLEMARRVAGDSDSALLHAAERNGGTRQVTNVGIRIPKGAQVVELGMEVDGSLAVAQLEPADARRMGAALVQAADKLAGPGVQQ